MWYYFVALRLPQASISRATALENAIGLEQKIMNAVQKSRIGIGFIGAGNIAEIHKAALLKIPGVALAAVYDVDEDRSRKLAADAGARVCHSADELVAARDVDVVYVLTPLAGHYENAVRSLRAGKHTFIEKPVSLSRKELLEMIRLSKANSCHCVPGHNYIHAPGLRSARQLIQSGRLGEICSLWIFFMVYLPEQICRTVQGVLREVMVHHFYSLLYLMGKPESVFATNSDRRRFGMNQEDQALVVCSMPGGAVATLFASFSTDDFTSDPWTLKYKILGSEGSASHTWSHTRLSGRPQPLWDLPAYWETFEEEDHYFIEECVRGGKKPLSELQDALTSLDILLAAEKSIETGASQKLKEDIALIKT